MPAEGQTTTSEEHWLALVDRFAGLVWSVPRGLGLATGPALEVAQTAWLRLVEELDAVTDVATWLLDSARAEAVRATRWHDTSTRADDEVLARLDDLPPRTRLASRVLAAGGDGAALAAALDVPREEADGLRAQVTARLAEVLGGDGLDRVRAAAERSDAPPAALLAAARAAHSWRTLDAELAPLDEGSLDALAGVRGDAGPQHLSFRATGLTVDVEVSVAGTARSLLGQLTPAGPAAVRVRSADGATRDVDVDDLGRFAVDGLPSGAVSLRVERSGAAPVRTAWVAL